MSSDRGGRNKWFKPEGVYGETERASHRPQMRKPTALERRRLSSQPEFTFFAPFIPMLVCPDAPDVLAEYCLASGKPITFVHWRLDQQLFPRMYDAGIDTANLFGVEGEDGKELINFAQGVIIQSEGESLAYRLLVQKVPLLEPGVSMAAPAEKLLTDVFDVHVFCVQTPNEAWYSVPAEPPTHLQLVRNLKQGDEGLWTVMNRFWKRESDRGSILD